jgi:hypothetical protein
MPDALTEGGRERSSGVVAEEHHLAGDRIDLGMRGEGTTEAAAVIAGAARGQRAGLDFDRRMAFLQRQQAAGMKHDIGVGDAAVAGGRCGSPRQFAAEAAEQRAAGIVFGLPFRGADPAVAVTGAAVLQMKGVQHAVADEPVRARHLELRIGAVAIERAIEVARQLALNFQEWRIALKRNRCPVGPRRVGRHSLLHGRSLHIFTP